MTMTAHWGRGNDGPKAIHEITTCRAVGAEQERSIFYKAKKMTLYTMHHGNIDVSYGCVIIQNNSGEMIACYSVDDSD